MKPARKIFILLVFVFGIIFYWLVPRINKAQDVQYTRFYEDTDTSKVFYTRDSSNHRQKKSKALSPKKNYKKESIQANSKFSELKPSMFSRSVQFVPRHIVLTTDTLLIDSLSPIDTITETTAR